MGRVEKWDIDGRTVYRVPCGIGGPEWIKKGPKPEDTFFQVIPATSLWAILDTMQHCGEVTPSGKEGHARWHQELPPYDEL